MILSEALEVVLSLAAEAHDNRHEAVKPEQAARESDALMHVRNLWLKEKRNAGELHRYQGRKDKQHG